jgi:hypothetical protein
MIWGLSVRRVFFAIAVFAVLPGSAGGQYVDVIETCHRDVSRHCAPSQAGENRLSDCIKVHFADFAQPCQAALVRIAAVRESCGADVQEHCRAVKPSAGRIFLCVRKHFSVLSEGCKDAITRAAERKVRR